MASTGWLDCSGSLPRGHARTGDHHLVTILELPAPDPEGDVVAPAPARAAKAGTRRFVAACLALTLAGALALVFDRHIGAELVSVGNAVGTATGRMRWPIAASVAGLGAAHYLAAAVAARAAAGTPTPLGETVLVQLAAATANRLTPAGLGGSALIARYFARRARLPVASALGAVTMLTLLGAVADLVLLSLLVSVGRLFGVPGGFGELTVLADRVRSFGQLGGSALTWIVVGAVISAAVLLLRRYRTRVGRAQLRAFWVPVVGLVRQPRRLATLMLGSVATTLMLSIGFAASATMTGGPRPAVAFGALMVGYMLGSAAGTSVPIPGGVGATEAVLVGVLVAAHVPVATAVTDVLVFRAITFWTPAVAGIAVARRLRRVGVL